MPTPSFLTNPVARDWLSKRGFDPDDPVVAELARTLGLNLGDQPSTGLGGDVSAFGRSAVRSIFDLGRGVADLPLALGRWTGFTDRRIEAGRPSPVEQVNSIPSGLGSLVGTLASFAVPETLLGRAGAVKKLQKLGRIEELGMPVSEVASLANRSQNMGRFAGEAASTDELLEFAHSLSGGMNLFSGLSPRAMIGRAATTAPSFALVEALQPGNIDERISRGVHGFLTGTTLGALGAPKGIGRGRSALRDSVAAIAAFGSEPIIPDTPIPGLLQQVLFGSAFGMMKGDKQVFPGEKTFAPTSPLTSPTVKREALIHRINNLRSKGLEITGPDRGSNYTEPLPQYKTLRSVGRLPASGDGTFLGRVQDNPNFRQADTLYASDFNQPLPPEIKRTLEENFIPQRILNPIRESQRKPPIIIRSIREELPETQRPSINARLNSVLYVRPKSPEAPPLEASPTTPRPLGPSLGVDETTTASLSMPERQAIADWEFKYGAKARIFDEYLARRRNEDSSLLVRAQKETRLSEHAAAIELFERQRKLIIEPSAQIIDPSTGKIIAEAEIPRILLPSDLDTYISPIERGRLTDNIVTTGSSSEAVIKNISDLAATLRRSTDPVAQRELSSFSKRLSAAEDAAVQSGLSPTILNSLSEHEMSRRQSETKRATEKFESLPDPVESHISRFHKLLSEICKGM